MVALWCQLSNMECGAILRWYHMEGSGCRVGRGEEKERNMQFKQKILTTLLTLKWMCF